MTMESKLQRAGHIAFSYGDQLIVWAGYSLEPSVHYCDPQEIIFYDPFTCKVLVKQSTGQFPPSNSGTCGVVVGDYLYVYGGYFGDPDVEGSSNNIYQLNLQTYVWVKLEPEGNKPLHRDKLLGWEYDNKIYFFGGFGTPPMDGGQSHEFVHDRSHNWYMGRGWNNELVAYDIRSNRWERPETKGSKPSPRAALAGFQSQSRVYVFGGRLLEERMNDLYILDLKTMTWSDNLNADKCLPRGRSWHSFTPVGSNKAILYGGLSTEGEALGDCWLYNMENNIWTEKKLKTNDKRRWHQCVHIENELIIVGGIQTDIRSNHQDSSAFPHQLLILLTSPKSLLRLCLENCVNFVKKGDAMNGLLPKHLLQLLDIRRNALLK